MSNLSGIKLKPYIPAILRKILWDEPYETIIENEPAKYHIVKLSCGHKVKIRNIGWYQGISSCPECREQELKKYERRN